MKYYPPKHRQEGFHCPHCGVYASQKWLRVLSGVSQDNLKRDERFDICVCSHCGQRSYWYKQNLVDPPEVSVVPPHEDLPEDCKLDYEEARSIFAASPRASAALLRLCVQKLLLHLGGSGKNINADIKELVEKGLPILVQQALDYCRVIGNNSVHPGEININDSPDVAASLFDMINFIVEDRITRPNQIQALYSRLPENARSAIQKRDSTSSSA
ncbi:DUF4145 domain-containing protein [Microcoleus sp. FACHB-1515]|uniref:DUF4145 domain-containing protein n=1 Tax=Cyanophyceae TaxID=3028117 RepID=UPI001681CE34|nr:DUF4145 domain-containing protein [Microcoleus sp. FACHB-1515]MBD2093142.1 DUF4145 domain-containing protein [Microcoleus sp. FACHB-1515]